MKKSATRELALWTARLASAGVFVLGLATSGLARDVCDGSGEMALRACLGSARADSRLASGKCLNSSDSAAVKACNQAAAAELRDQLDTCMEQDEARDPVCARLGPSAYDPPIDPANFVAVVDNPYFPLTPGTTFVYEGQTAEGFVHNDVVVTHNTRVILGVTCTEVHDVVFIDGTLAEDTVDWFAQDMAGNVWYFGENTGELVNGRVVTLEGTFTAGDNGAKPGIIMEAHPAVGDFYRQEFDLGNAEDLAEVTSLTDTATVPFRPMPFTNCLTTRETTPLEPSLNENKVYAVGVGNILTVDNTNGDRIELIAITH